MFANRLGGFHEFPRPVDRLDGGLAASRYGRHDQTTVLEEQDLHQEADVAGQDLRFSAEATERRTWLPADRWKHQGVRGPRSERCPAEGLRLLVWRSLGSSGRRTGRRSSLGGTVQVRDRASLIVLGLIAQFSFIRLSTLRGG
ncbi:MAG: hypothetical protein UT02_C0006G0002 [Parcubacteria group bacterium GW2011_GWC2_38_7]|nr:MAG: hypothetical protein UT02_C0006G0002 [Parcubacteria group bacterium GW2011_GWC2_38_7]